MRKPSTMSLATSSSNCGTIAPGNQLEHPALLRLRLQVEIDRIAGTAQRLRIRTRRNVHPRFTGLATKASEKFLECSDNRLEILLSEVGPFVVVNSFVDCPLLDADGGVRGG